MATTIVSCFLTTEAQSRTLAQQLRQFGFYDRYEETVHGERILISIKTRNFRERDIVRSLLTAAGFTDFIYTEEGAA
jgi:hypothetical protein